MTACSVGIGCRLLWRRMVRTVDIRPNPTFLVVLRGGASTASLPSTRDNLGLSDAKEEVPCDSNLVMSDSDDLHLSNNLDNSAAVLQLNNNQVESTPCLTIASPTPAPPPLLKTFHLFPLPPLQNEPAHPRPHTPPRRDRPARRPPRHPLALTRALPPRSSASAGARTSATPPTSFATPSSPLPPSRGGYLYFYAPSLAVGREARAVALRWAEREGLARLIRAPDQSSVAVIHWTTAARYCAVKVVMKGVTCQRSCSSVPTVSSATRTIATRSQWRRRECPSASLTRTRRRGGGLSPWVWPFGEC
ncbi:hypothetical protein B0T18DRAFT_167506 [Schizothecium vesticola]|uniref:Uncharacterized protein n=1 Tax=Schizothecium vesticola TaxID=314040 RepID=A0AA40ENK3_9PEZI|nr:hypothetical protein B0T18DRAFT_167506 [Schizothecium vesticola]